RWSLVAHLGGCGAGGGLVGDGLAGGVGGDEGGGGGEPAGGAGGAAGGVVDERGGVIGEQGVAAAGEAGVMPQVTGCLFQGHGLHGVADGDPLVERGEHAS